MGRLSTTECTYLPTYLRVPFRLPLHLPGCSSPEGSVAVCLLPVPGCSSPWHRAFRLSRSCIAGCRLSPSAPLLRLLLLSLHGSCSSCPLSSVPCSCSCSPCLFLPPPLPPPYAAPDALIQGLFFPRCSSPGLPLPGCYSPGAFLLSACRFVPPDAPVQGVPLPRMLQSVALGSAPPDDPVWGLCSNPPRMLQCGASDYHIILVVIGRWCWCVCFPGFFFARASSLLFRHSSPSFSAFNPVLPPSPSSLSRFPLLCPFPFPLGPLSSLPPAPLPSLCGGFAGARTQARSFYARMLL